MPHYLYFKGKGWKYIKGSALWSIFWFTKTLWILLIISFRTEPITGLKTSESQVRHYQRWLNLALNVRCRGGHGSSRWHGVCRNWRRKRFSAGQQETRILTSCCHCLYCAMEGPVWFMPLGNAGGMDISAWLNCEVLSNSRFSRSKYWKRVRSLIWSPASV